MDKIEAGRLLDEFIEHLRNRPHDELLGLISNPVCKQFESSNGVVYQIEYEAIWDSKPSELLRIIASIDDGGFINTLFPISKSFVVGSKDKVLE